MDQRKFTLPKSARLKSKKVAGILFKKGTTVFSYPFKVWVNNTPSSTCKILVSVPKRQFARSVDRHRISRQIRESYRLNKQLLQISNPNSTEINYLCAEMGIVYIAKEKMLTSVIETKLKDIMRKIIEKNTKA